MGEDIPRKKDILPWCFFFLAIATRVPFASRLLLHMDSCQFALALDKYDITVHQPHPPGYFLYVMTGRLLNLFLADPNTVFVSISIFSSGLAIAGIYLLGKEMFEPKIGAVAALLALTSPSIWFHGEVSLTYIVEACFSTFIALFCWRILSGREKYLWISVIALGVAGGIRQNTPVFLIPLWLYSVKNVPARNIIASLAVLAVTCLLWFVPMVGMTGGWDSYCGAFRELWMFHTGGHSLLEGKWFNSIRFSLKLGQYVVFGLGAILFPFAVAAYSTARRGRLKSMDRRKVLFLSLWVLPAVMFYLSVFLSLQNPGYALVLLPALFLPAAWSVFHLGKDFGERHRRIVPISILAAVVVLNTAAFFLLEFPVSYRWIRTHDRNLSALLDDARTSDPGKTVVFVNNLIYYSYRHFMVYLPVYRVYNVDVRTAGTGERRKTFGGVGGETVLEDTISLPGNVTRFVTPIDVEDVKYGERKMYESAGLAVRDITPTMFVASGPIGMLAHVYPEMRVSFERMGSGP